MTRWYSWMFQKKSLENLFKFLSSYEASSGQLINKGKSALYLSKKISYARKLVIQNVYGIPEKEFPFKYFGVPIIKDRLKTIFFSEIISKVRKKVEGWQGNLLNLAGRTVLIKHVLSSIPLHMLAGTPVPKGILAFIKLTKSWRDFSGRIDITLGTDIGWHGMRSPPPSKKGGL